MAMLGMSALAAACDPIVTTGTDGQPRVSYPSGCAQTTVDVIPDSPDVYHDQTGKVITPRDVGQWFAGISNNTVLIAGGVVAGLIFLGGRRR